MVPESMQEVVLRCSGDTMPCNSLRSIVFLEPGNHIKATTCMQVGTLPIGSHAFKVKGSAKVTQLGKDAMMKILDAIITGSEIDNRNAVIFWEINCGVGNVFDAFVSKKQGWNFPSYYFTSIDDPIQYDWMTYDKEHAVMGMHLQKQLSVTGYEVIPEEMPAALLNDPPTLPSLVKLAAVPVKQGEGETTMKLTFPDHLIKMWHDNPEFGQQFQAKLLTFYEEVGNYNSKDAALDKKNVDGNPVPLALQRNRVRR